MTEEILDLYPADDAPFPYVLNKDGSLCYVKKAEYRDFSITRIGVETKRDNESVTFKEVQIVKETKTVNKFGVKDRAPSDQKGWRGNR